MDIAKNVARIKDNLLLIPAERFDTLAADKDYQTSFVYFMACIILSIPLSLLVALALGDFMGILLSIPASVIVSVILAYIIFGVQHLLLRLLGGQATFLQSVQVFVYGTTPSIIFGTIPVLGFVASLIGLANVVLGSARVHKISVLRAIAAIIIIPTVLLILLFVALYAYLAPASVVSGPA